MFIILDSFTPSPAHLHTHRAPCYHCHTVLGCATHAVDGGHLLPHTPCHTPHYTCLACLPCLPCALPHTATARCFMLPARTYCLLPHALPLPAHLAARTTLPYRVLHATLRTHRAHARARAHAAPALATFKLIFCHAPAGVVAGFWIKRTGACALYYALPRCYTPPHRTHAAQYAAISCASIAFPATPFCRACAAAHLLYAFLCRTYTRCLTT